MGRFSRILLLALFSVGCRADRGTAAEANDATAAFQTDSSVVHFQDTGTLYVGRIDGSFTNRASTTIYIVNCQGATGISLEKRVGEQWVSVWSPVLPACLSGPIVIAPLQSKRFSVPIAGGHPEATNIAPRFLTDEIPGTYRLVWQQVVDGYDFIAPNPAGKIVDLPYRASNEFVVVTKR